MADPSEGILPVSIEDAPNVPKPEAPVTPSLPVAYNAAVKARAAGFSWDEINQGFQAKREEAQKAGFTDAEINQSLGLPPGYASPGNPMQDKIGPLGTTRGSIEAQGKEASEALTDVGAAFSAGMDRPLYTQNMPGPLGVLARSAETWAVNVPAAMYLGGATAVGHMLESHGMPKEDAARLTRDLIGMPEAFSGSIGSWFGAPETQLAHAGMSMSDVHAFYGSDIANAMHATHELAEGRPMSAPYKAALEKEAAPYLSMPSVLQATNENRRMPLGLPHTQDVLDAAAGITKGEGDVAGVAQRLGQHFIETGEHPLDTAERAQSDPALMRFLKAEGGGVGGQGYTAYNPITDEGSQIVPSLIARPKQPGLMRAIKDNVQYWFNPGKRTPEADITAQIIRHTQATRALRDWKSAETLRQFGRAIADMTPQEGGSFIHAYETGDLGAYEGTPLGAGAKALHALTDYHWNELNKRGLIRAYRENYLPHLYENPNEAEAGLSRYFAQPSKSFTKERQFSSYLEAAQQYGLKPRTSNAFELGLSSAMQQSKAIAHFDILKELQDRNLIVHQPYNLPLKETWRYTGMKRVNSGLVPPSPNGFHVAPPEVADVIDRWLQPAWDGQPIYDLLRSSGNTLNMAQLMLSGFHAKYLAGAGMLARNAQAFQQISRATPEEILRGLGNVAVSPIAPIKQALIGRKLLAQVMGTKDFGPEMKTLADAYIAGGNKLKYDRLYQASALGSFWDSIKGSIEAQSKKFEGDNGLGPMTLDQAIRKMFQDAKPITVFGRKVLPGAVRATAMIVPRTVETVMHPLMGWFVPMMKAGAYAEKMADELRVNPTMSVDEMRAISQRITQHVENIEGQMIADNRFWNKSLVATGNLTFRAFTWMVGKLDELGGGVSDLAKGRSVMAGDMKQITERAATVASLLTTSVYMGALYGMFKGTWNAGWSGYDYLFPPTGGKDSSGGEERIILLGLLQDAAEWSQHPEDTAVNKLHPAIAMLNEMANDQDFYGATISDPMQPDFQRGMDYADFFISQFDPISMRTPPGQEESELGPFARAMGFRPAPYFIEEPGKEAAFEQRELKKGLKKRAREEGE